MAGACRESEDSENRLFRTWEEALWKGDTPGNGSVPRWKEVQVFPAGRFDRAWPNIMRWRYSRPMDGRSVESCRGFHFGGRIAELLFLREEEL